jgi:hypothetical protein
MAKRSPDREMLTMALVGFEVRRQKLVEAISNLRAELASRSKGRAQPKAKMVDATPASRLSTAGRKRIADAQRKRWRKMKRRMTAAVGVKRKSTAKQQKKMPTAKGTRRQQRVSRGSRKASITISATKNPSNASDSAAVTTVALPQVTAEIAGREIETERVSVD